MEGSGRGIEEEGYAQLPISVQADEIQKIAVQRGTAGGHLAAAEFACGIAGEFYRHFFKEVAVEEQ